MQEAGVDQACWYGRARLLVWVSPRTKTSTNIVKPDDRRKQTDSRRSCDSVHRPITINICEPSQWPRWFWRGLWLWWWHRVWERYRQIWEINRVRSAPGVSLTHADTFQISYDRAASRSQRSRFLKKTTKRNGSLRPERQRRPSRAF